MKNIKLIGTAVITICLIVGCCVISSATTKSNSNMSSSCSSTYASNKVSNSTTVESMFSSAKVFSSQLIGGDPIYSYHPNEKTTLRTRSCIVTYSANTSWLRQENIVHTVFLGKIEGSVVGDWVLVP